MNAQFIIRGLRVSAGTRSWLEQRLEGLQSLIPITTAAVVLEHRGDLTPAFRTFVLLAVPGPDIHAEARDYTLEATWLKVLTLLRKQIERRKTRQLARAKQPGDLRRPVMRRVGSSVGAGA
jgi:ribosome-associated translation inhibitor RaiA